MNTSKDNAGNLRYAVTGYDTPFYSRVAAQHAEWLSAQLRVHTRPIFRVILPTRVWVECTSRSEAQAIVAQSGGQIV